MSEALESKDSERMVQVKRFRDPFEAQMAKGMLESVGIECFLQGENANALYPMALGAGLDVRACDEEAAKNLLLEAEIDLEDHQITRFR